MSFEEMVFLLVGTIAGVGLIGYLASKIFILIKTWINRNSSSIPEEEFDRLAKAFMQHKKETERRLKNLETIASEENSDSAPSSKQIEAPKEEIEIQDQESKQEKSESGGENNLRNMLQE